MLPIPPAIVAVAQPPANARPPRPNPGPKKPSPFSLAAAVDKIAWDESRGVLLIVAPERVMPGSSNPMLAMGMMDESFESDQVPDELKPKPLPPVPARGYAADMLATHFNRKLVRAGGVSTFALVETYDLNAMMDRMSGMTDAVGDMGRDEVRLLPLLASLSKAQWSAAASPQGIGRESMSPQQAALWDAALPVMATFHYPAGKAPARKEPSQADVLKALAGDAAAGEALKSFLPPTLSPEQAGGLRLRIARDLSLIAPPAPVPGAKPSDDVDEDGGLLTLDPDEADDSRDDAREVFIRMNPAMRKMMENPLAAMMPPKVRVQPKATDVNVKAGALQVRIPLAGVTTLGQLVERIAKTVGVPMFADRRYEALGVVVRGESAAAGDLIEAMTRAINGAFRRLGDGDEQLFLLTDDIVPAARRSGPLMDRMMALYGPMARQMRNNARAGASARLQIARMDVVSGVSRGHGNDLPESLWRAAEKADNSVRVPLSQLPERYQALARKEWSERPDEIKSTKLPPDRAYGHIDLRVELLWPETGAVAELSSFDLKDFLVSGEAKPVPLVTWSPKLPVRGLSAPLPTDDAGRKRLVDVAAARGFTHLFVSADAPGAVESVAALAKLAAPAGLALVPTLAPIVGVFAPPSAPRDVSLRGETVLQWGARRDIRALAATEPYFQALFDSLVRGDFLVPEAVDPVSVASAAERLSGLPGVGYVGVRGLSLPGYTGVDSDWMGMIWSGGGTLGARRNFVRAHHVDPADLAEGGMGMWAGMMGGDLGDVRALSRVEGEWRKSQAGRLKAMIARLDTVLKRSATKAPVIGLSEGWALWSDIARWDPVAEMGDHDDDAPSAPTATKPESKELPGLSLRHIHTIEMLEEAMRDDSPTSENQLRSDLERFRAFVQSSSDDMVSDTEEERSAKVEGFVLELSHLSVADTIAALEATVAEQKRPEPAPPAPSKPKPAAPKGKKP